MRKLDLYRGKKLTKRLKLGRRTVDESVLDALTSLKEIGEQDYGAVVFAREQKKIAGVNIPHIPYGLLSTDDVETRRELMFETAKLFTANNDIKITEKMLQWIMGEATGKIFSKDDITTIHKKLHKSPKSSRVFFINNFVASHSVTKSEFGVETEGGIIKYEALELNTSDLLADAQTLQVTLRNPVTKERLTIDPSTLVPFTPIQINKLREPFIPLDSELSHETIVAIPGSVRMLDHKTKMPSNITLESFVRIRTDGPLTEHTKEMHDAITKMLTLNAHLINSEIERIIKYRKEDEPGDVTKNLYVRDYDSESGEFTYRMVYDAGEDPLADNPDREDEQDFFNRAVHLKGFVDYDTYNEETAAEKITLGREHTLTDLEREGLASNTKARTRTEKEMEKAYEQVKRHADENIRKDESWKRDGYLGFETESPEIYEEKFQTLRSNPQNLSIADWRTKMSDAAYDSGRLIDPEILKLMYPKGDKRNEYNNDKINELLATLPEFVRENLRGYTGEERKKKKIQWKTPVGYRY